jgi:TPR repeat protein
MLADALRTGTGTAQDEVAAAGWYRKAAAQRNTEAEYRMGLCLESGTGVPRDRAAAVQLFFRAAAQGHAYAQTKAGLACLTGEGARKDALEAAIWFGLALSGDPAADVLFTKAHDELTQTQIGDLYQRMNDFFSDNHRELAALPRPAP